MRDQVARAFHRESPLGAGAFVACDCANEEDRLRVALEAWMEMGGSREANPYREAERGTLYLDPVERLGPETQKLLLEIGQRLHGEAGGRESPGPGRLVAGNPRPVAEAVAEGRFLAALHDALDKVRVELEGAEPPKPN